MWKRPLRLEGTTRAHYTDGEKADPEVSQSERWVPASGCRLVYPQGWEMGGGVVSSSVHAAHRALKVNFLMCLGQTAEDVREASPTR